jgi:hypothetical protein
MKSGEHYLNTGSGLIHTPGDRQSLNFYAVVQ